jgi:hypothetical protein
VKNAFKSIATILLALVYWFVLSSVNANAFDFKANDAKGSQKISSSVCSQIFSHASEKGNSFNDFSQSNASFKGQLSTDYHHFIIVEAFFRYDLSLFSKHSENKELRFQRIARLFPCHYFL